MRMPRTLFLGVAALVAVSCAAPPPPPPAVWPAGTVVDLSHAFDERAIFWPTAEGFHLQKVADGMTPGGYYYAANAFTTAEHGGTHLDAPVHFAKGALAVDAIPLDQLIGAAVVVDVSAKCAADADYRVSVGDLQAFEQAQGRIPDRAILLIRTGFSARWPDAARYLGTAERGPAAVAKLHFPGLHPDAATWLVNNRKVGAVGIDTASVDYGQSTAFETHRILY